jgi:FKBP-type peptidyl-prolyl cis-trans isomerase FkpA/FKBP-type peptidyl-prolyl cis-trans isomerase FklB
MTNNLMNLVRRLDVRRMSRQQQIVFGAISLTLVLTFAIFGPGGWLSGLTDPRVVEAPVEAEPTENPTEADMTADLSPAKNEAFLVANAKKEGVTVTESGLQIRQIKAGSGKRPGATSKVTVHYTGKLINGKQFDSSVGGDPISFPLNRVIAGWTEGLQLMQEGEKAELVIPQHLGYGEQGAPGAIPPLQTLVFEVELIKVQ